MTRFKFVMCLFIFFFFTSPAIADDWTKEDTLRQCALTTLICIDWLQTQEIVKQDHNEMNPFLGQHPSMSRVNLMIGGAIVISFLAAKYLPTKYRRWFQYIVIGAESGMIYNNYQRGIRINF